MPASQLIPPPDIAPPSISHLSFADRVRLWAQIVDEGDQFVADGFRRRHESDADVQRAIAEWLERRNADSLTAKMRVVSGRRRMMHDGQ